MGYLEAFELSYRKRHRYIQINMWEPDSRQISFLEFHHSCYREKFGQARVQDCRNSEGSACIQCGKEFPPIKTLETMAKFQDLKTPDEQGWYYDIVPDPAAPWGTRRVKRTMR